MKILVCGASGLIGSTILRVLSDVDDWDAIGTLRSGNALSFFPNRIAQQMLTNVELTDSDTLCRLFAEVKPDLVINCAGLTKHLPGSDDPLTVLPINTLLPHRLARLCKLSDARLVHISTDCIFSGKIGNYSEDDLPDAADIYGRSKAMGEVAASHAVTLRTSTIGHELHTTYGLLDWFLSQGERCRGFRKAIFSGLPTVVLAGIIRDYVIPRRDLQGIYQVAAEPISKYDLLRLIADVYGKSIEVEPDESFVIDRSLNPKRFNQATGFYAPAWPELIRIMHTYQMDLRR